jgi:hypothetical protein
MAVNEVILAETMLMILIRPFLEQAAEEIAKAVLERLGTDVVIHTVKDSEDVMAETRARLGLPDDYVPPTKGT